MAVYLHEIVDVVPTRAADYLDGIGRHQGEQRRARGEKNTMLGLWMGLAATGPFPVAINLWENRTWQRQAEAMESQFEPRRQNAELKNWWLSNLDLRRGGFDRLIESTEWTADVATLRARGSTARLFVHQIVRTGGDRVDEYLAALGREGVPALEGAGASLVCGYRVCLRDDEALVLVGLHDGAALGRLLAAWHTEDDSRLARWRQREDSWVRHKDTLLLRPRHFLSSPWHD